MKKTISVADMRPNNVEEEKHKFFFDSGYNPQFEYDSRDTEDAMQSYGKISVAHLKDAKRILDTVIAKWGTDTAFSQETSGDVLGPEPAKKAIRAFLHDLNLQNEILVRYSTSFIARTSMQGANLNVRLPLKYRELSLQSMLYHEVGTHYLRTWSERQQPWYQHHHSYNFTSHLETEEGLAVIHGLLPRKERYLFHPALAYFAAYRADHVSFSQLFSELRPYVEDKASRWSICVKAKRGQRDSSQPGGNSRNQLYLRGAIVVLQWLRENGYDAEPLYVGKVSLRDLPAALAQNVLPSLRLPPFLADEREYRKAIDDIIETNQLTIKESTK